MRASFENKTKNRETTKPIFLGDDPDSLLNYRTREVDQPLLQGYRHP